MDKVELSETYRRLMASKGNYGEEVERHCERILRFPEEILPIVFFMLAIMKNK